MGGEENGWDYKSTAASGGGQTPEWLAQSLALAIGLELQKTTSFLAAYFLPFY